MEQTASQKWTLKLDWNWVLASYCYLVLLHLFPTYLLGGVRAMDIASYNSAIIVWLFFGLLLIAIYVGYKSAGFTVLEPGLAGLAYALTLSMGFDKVIGSNVSSQRFLSAVFWGIIALMLSVFGAWIGEVVQSLGKGRIRGGGPGA